MIGLKEVLLNYRINLSGSIQEKKDKNPLDFYNALKNVRDFFAKKEYI